MKGKVMRHYSRIYKNNEMIRSNYGLFLLRILRI